VSLVWRETRHHEPAFGAGGSEPYARALRSAGGDALYLQELRNDRAHPVAAMDVARWASHADEVDLRLLASVRGPVLDVGCGPGRMVRAAMDLGLDALGLDVSAAVVDIVRANGLPVHHGSVFDRLPLEGEWHTVLLVDGNVGIGGDVSALLSRCRDLLGEGGEIVVEVHPDADRDRTFTGRLVDLAGGRSASFPWAEIGLPGLISRAGRLALEPRQAWSEGDRSFCRLAKTRA
jgi:SAM-dependent methyltransferase